MKKYALVLVIGLMFLLAACGNSGSGSDDKNQKARTLKIQ